MDGVLSQRRHARHPVGLTIVAGLHVLVALALWSTRMRIDPPPGAQAVLTEVDDPMTLHAAAPSDLPGPQPRALPRIVAPVPEGVVDHEALQATPVVAPPDPSPATAAEETSMAMPSAPVSGTDHPGTDPVDSAGGGTAPVVHVEPHPPRIIVAAPDCQPAYPRVASNHMVAGTTRLRFTVDASGRVTDVRVLRKSGEMSENDLLDRTAAEALARCPALAGIDASGKSVGGTADVNYIWQLH